MDLPNEKHPDSTYAAQYPYNSSTVTKSGHEIDIDDTEGAERIRIAHTNGTYIEMGKDGRFDLTVNHGMYENIVGGKSEYVNGQKETTIKGALKQDVFQSASLQIAHDYHVGIGSNYSMSIGGVYSTMTKGDYKLFVGGSSMTVVHGDNNSDIIGDEVNHIGGTKVDNVLSDWSVNAGGSIEMINQSGSGVFHVACKNFVIEAESITLITPGGVMSLAGALSIISQSINMNSTNKVNVTGSQIHLNDSSS